MTEEILKKFSVERLQELEKYLQERLDQIGSSRPITINQPTFWRDKIDWKEDEREYLNIVKKVLSEKKEKTNESKKLKHIKLFEEMKSDSRLWWDNLSSSERDDYFEMYSRDKERMDSLRTTDVDELDDYDIEEIYNEFK